MEPSLNLQSKVEFLKKLPGPARLNESLGQRPEKYLIIYDKRLQRNPSIAGWLKEFDHTYGVRAGEELKDFYSFPQHIKKILKQVGPFSAHTLAVVGVGGGTIGDFAGFVASVLKRGLPLIHVPSTLLAAMDSAHGGKNGLNVGEAKNQVGTFYPAKAVLIVKSLFEDLPQLQLQSASGELAKIALLQGGQLMEKLRRDFLVTLENIWELLPQVIEAKYKIVEQDPYEKTGERQLLNLGHTLGHALEGYYGLAHGLAVGEGLIFALNWSQHHGYFREDAAATVNLLIERLGLLAPRDFARKHRPMSRRKLEKLIAADKKLTDARNLTFVFLHKAGEPFRKNVTIEALLAESQRQGWTSS